jgi:hypothetical protein
MPTAPIYNIGDVVYLRESAALGFLEAYAIHSMRYLPNGTVLYKMITSLAPPTAVQSIGDRVTTQRIHPLEVLETELVDYCDALTLCHSNLQAQLANIESLALAAGYSVTG